ncbi:hypothetical protein TraAM80_05684 [Trypanosoma rangeli]|uniref:Cilia-and flagella-associated protein 96 n=1 Tax=Trypanosoma rangeli TaxID=5698 RepID=A0A422NDP9_TRYRA|nr:uncharacterized protein TraAM80_05684 [Trypanosoma rangeli]RNF03512.1 hypothetical protein TraAM80_05684 [Trypanosoma rangeli]|eukprot:RNF03512.1 hypothetical protein TraAM80_05684 [Trypanosoma rangeli]
MFSEPVYLSLMDEYDKPHTTSSLGKNPAGAKSFVVPMKRSPHITDAVFQKPFISLAVGDEYVPVPPGGTFRQPVEGRKGTMVVSVPFKPPSRPHKPNGSGTYYGTFNETNPPRHEAELPLVEIKKAGTTADATLTWPKRKIYTNPGKKGTYGYVGLTIGKAGEVQYIADPIKSAVSQRSCSPSSQKPFRAAVKRGGCFDESEHGFSTVYCIKRPLPPKKLQVPRPLPDIKPWRPAGALVKDITKSPEYQEDPYELKEKRIREERQKGQSYKPWCPAGNDPYRYIYTYPVRFDPPPVQ